MFSMTYPPEVSMKYAGKALAPRALMTHTFKANYLALSDLFCKFSHALARTAERYAVGPALNTARIDVYYQPHVDLDTGLPVGVEALARWRRCDGRLVPPADFLPHIQTMKHLLALDLHVLEKAVRQSVVWAGKGINPVISVNISAAHFDRLALAEKVEKILARVPAFNPSKLAIEILESAAITNPKVAAEIIERLRRLGIQFYLDDFGTGHSSAAYLKLFPVDAIKLDQIFARDIPHGPNSELDTAIIKASVSIAHACGLGVIAEGIETQEAAVAVKRLGCQTAQGYFYARPLPEMEFVSWYESRSRRP
jgi:EAL domain-containing protein (putative c-di-GMP-specific phosphodiesterase class I)